ncbi:MAG: hypothetical protein CVV27_07245, partial [Candidatus Melainabacteria bacterium HGW-Melainabacteria-1]
SFLYEYDFNDGWEHELLVEKIRPIPDQEAEQYPLCLEGENACPPEDCGGIFGYYELLTVLKDPSHPAFAEFKQQYGEIEPGSFDLNHANQRLQDLFHEGPQTEAERLADYH